MLLSNTLIRPFGYGWFRLCDDIMFLQSDIRNRSRIERRSFSFGFVPNRNFDHGPTEGLFWLGFVCRRPCDLGPRASLRLLDKAFDACKHTVETTSTLGTDDTVRRVI